MTKIHLLALALASAVLSLPANAQLGPAGVPGAPGLATPPAVVKTAPPPEVKPATIKSPRTVKSPTKKRHTPAKAPAKNDCRHANDPARCELHAKVRKTCQAQSGEAHRQCLRDQLAPGK